MPRKAKRPQILQVVGGSQSNLVPSLPNMYPTAAAATANVAAATNVATPDIVSATLMAMGANPYVIGIFYMFLNLGGRFLSLELTKRQEQFLSQPYVRPFILFAVMFIATRNLAVAFYTTIIILSVLWVFANENSLLCLIPSWRVKQPDHAAIDKSYEETMAKLKKRKDEGHHDEGDHAEGHHAEGHHAEGHHAEGDHAEGHHAEGHHAEGDHAEGDHAEIHNEEKPHYMDRHE